VVEGLKKIYKSKILPLEQQYFFHDFHSPELSDPDFDARPMILLVGQYSTGKTTFIRYLLEKDFPGNFFKSYFISKISCLLRYN
jgi:polynucleotide 5'-kinase involved in rRNA processing